jgi:hypothetical protein
MPAYLGRAICDRVPLGKRNHSEYKRQRLELEHGLADAQILESYYTHEAGHLYYFERAGFSGFEFYGPEMEYDPDIMITDEKDKYSYFPAAVRSPEFSKLQDCDENELCAIAKAAVAGGVFVEVFLQSSERGDKQDYKDFKKVHLKMYKNDHTLGYDPAARWAQAQIDVKTELQQLTDRTEIQLKIMEVKYECFGLR